MRPTAEVETPDTIVVKAFRLKTRPDGDFDLVPIDRQGKPKQITRKLDANSDLVFREDEWSSMFPDPFIEPAKLGTSMASGTIECFDCKWQGDVLKFPPKLTHGQERKCPKCGSCRNEHNIEFKTRFNQGAMYA